MFSHADPDPHDAEDAAAPSTHDHPHAAELPDLGTQFEDLLAAVLHAEADWRFYDLLDLAERLRPPQRRTDA